MQLKRHLLLVAIAAAAACTTPTTIERAWRDPSFAGAPLQKVLVIGRVNSEANRRTLEDSYVSALSQHGVAAMASYQAFQDAHPDRSAVQQYLVNQGYDGALVTMYKGMRTQVYVSPSSDFYGYYGGYWDQGYYTDTEQFVKVETSLWDARTAKLIWTASSETENPSSAQDAISSVVSTITKSLTDAHLIGPARAVSSAVPPQRAVY
jgi:hypothetical protein